MGTMTQQTVIWVAYYPHPCVRDVDARHNAYPASPLRANLSTTKIMLTYHAYILVFTWSLRRLGVYPR